MTGKTNLNDLTKNMSPQLVDTDYVFCSLGDIKWGEFAELNPLASFLEKEGMTLVIEASKADEHHIEYDSKFKCITLQVHSSLNAVGLTALVAGSLADANISANVMAAYYHDHIFIPSDKGQQALQVLQALKHNM